MEHIDSQAHMIRLWLEEGNVITPIDALNMFGCFRLSAIIFVLKERGMNIKSNMVYNGKKRYAEYFLEKE